MIPGSFTYFAPGSLPDALSLLQQHGDEAKILAGGQSLIPVMRFRLAEPKYIVDINRVPGLSGVSQQGDRLVIGALTREVDLERSELVRERLPILFDASEVIADPLVRNLATVGGNLAHADPANDHPAAMLALRAELLVTGPSGERIIPIDDFFVDSFTTSLQADEILTAIRIPIPTGRAGGAYAKLERKVGDYAIAASAVQLSLTPDDTIEQIDIGLTNASYIPMRAANAEAALRGRIPSDEAIREAAAAAADEANPSADLRGPVEYKRAMIRTMTTRALRRALERARGQ